MYGYGLKSMMLSMIETACRITGGEGNMHCVKEIVRLGQELLQRPVTLLNGVEEVLLPPAEENTGWSSATKGDLFDQRRKVRESGLMHYFCHIGIMSDKKEADYRKLLTTVECAPQNFLMFGETPSSRTYCRFWSWADMPPTFLTTSPGSMKPSDRGYCASQLHPVKKHHGYNGISPVR